MFAMNNKQLGQYLIDKNFNTKVYEILTNALCAKKRRADFLTDLLTRFC